MEKRPDVQMAVEGLYQAFSAYPSPAYTDPCLHCHTLEEEAKLRSVPLKQLSVADLDTYTNDALLVWGSVDHFKHFLPRIFDLYFSMSEPTFEFLDPEILFSKFRHGHWLTWTMQEQTAVRELLQAIWDQALGDPPPSSSSTDVQSWLCSIAQAEDNLEPYLQTWVEDQRMSASFALSSMLLTNAGRNAFWDGRETQYAQLQTWLKSQQVVTKLKTALIRAEGTSATREFEAALGCVDFTLP
jgi:hypothetical protein